jgi:hypothetical protein
MFILMYSASFPPFPQESELSRVVPSWVPEERRKDFAHFVSGFPNVVRQMGLDEEEKVWTSITKHYIF